jgi:membrane associated rhomboid family serine protease
VERLTQDPGPECVSLEGRGGRRILYELHGVEHPVHPTGPGRTFTRYEDITHLATSKRGLWLGTQSAALLIPRGTFPAEQGPEQAYAELMARIEQGPGGAVQLAHIAEVEAIAQREGHTAAVWGLAALCGVVFLVQLLVGSDVHEVGYHSGPLVSAGDFWRIVTANFVHAFPTVPVHMGVNLLGAIVIGGIAERSLGAIRTIVVMGASGLLAMQLCSWLGYPPVVGASGIVAGLLGSLTWLEFFRAEDLPAWWRLPRRPLIGVLLASVLIDWFVPAFAGAAHIGGFFGGVLATWAVAGRPVRSETSPGWVRGLAIFTLLIAFVGTAKAGIELATTEDYAARNLSVIAELPGVTPEELNQRAWLIAIDEDSTQELLVAALRAAERAVELSERQESAILDTLAEVNFVLGNQDAALAAIGEAIALAPFDTYYQEQRRRYTGERAADDRPDPPMLGFSMPQTFQIFIQGPPPPATPQPAQTPVPN